MCGIYSPRYEIRAPLSTYMTVVKLSFGDTHARMSTEERIRRETADGDEDGDQGGSERNESEAKNTRNSNPFMDAAYCSAQQMLQQWARNVLKETAASLLQRRVIARHEKLLMKLDLPPNLRHRKMAEFPNELTGDIADIFVSEEDAGDAYYGARRLGQRWVKYLHQAGQTDAAQAVLEVCDNGRFLEVDDNIDRLAKSKADDFDYEHASVSLNFLNNDTSYACDLAQTDQPDNSREGRSDTRKIVALEGEMEANPDLQHKNFSDIGWVDPCNLNRDFFDRQLTSFPVTSPNQNNLSAKVTGGILPGKTVKDGMYLPQTAIMSPSQLQPLLAGQAFGRPAITFDPVALPASDGSTFHQQKWVREQIRAIDELGYGGKTSWPYNWKIVHDAAIENRRRLHWIGNGLKNSRSGGDDASDFEDAVVEYEVVPKSMLTELDDRSTKPAGSGGVEDDNESTSRTARETHSKTSPSNFHKELESGVHGEDELFDQPKIQSELPNIAMSKWLKDKLKHKSSKKRLSPSANSTTIEPLKTRPLSPPSARRASYIGDCSIIWKDVRSEWDENGVGSTLVSVMLHKNDNDATNTAIGALKNLGNFHQYEQGKADRLRGSHMADYINPISANDNVQRRAQKKAKRERLGGWTHDVKLKSTTELPKSQYTKVVRMEKDRGEEWIELDIGECIVELSIMSESEDGNKENEKRLFRFRSLEISLLDGVP